MRFMDRFNEFKTLPSGESFSIKVTDQEATAAAYEYLAENREQVRERLQKSTGMKLQVEDPSIEFRNDEVFVSAKGGMGFLKAKASLTAEVQWDGKLNVVARSVEVPFVSVSPQKLNSAVKRPLEQLMKKVEEYADIQSLKLTNGFAVLEAVRK